MTLLLPVRVELHTKLKSALKQTGCKLGQIQIELCRDGLVRHGRNCRLGSACQSAEVMLIDIFAMALVDRHVL